MDIGDRFPEFNLPDENGEMFSSGCIEGMRFVVYFYKSDGSPEDAAEAVDFNGYYPKLILRNILTIGISGDPPDSHRSLIANNNLKIKLLSDSDGGLVSKVCTANEERCTFIIGKDGTVEAVWHNVSARGHADQVYDRVRSLSKL